ncbi:hypothetical protein [Streptomyces sp. NPDC006552]|uniref:hypothetical protein n=1 Tax=Streptomyces sp. NPDC006552 TaxID=3157179 RepID=UPI0033A1720C
MSDTDRDEDLVDVDVHDDGTPYTFGWLQAPNAAAVLAAVRGDGPIPATGLATRHQLRALGLRPRRPGAGARAAVLARWPAHRVAVPDRARAAQEDADAGPRGGA